MYVHEARADGRKKSGEGSSDMWVAGSGEDTLLTTAIAKGRWSTEVTA